MNSRVAVGSTCFFGGSNRSNGSNSNTDLSHPSAAVRPDRERTAGVLRRRWQRRPECGRAGHGAIWGSHGAFLMEIDGIRLGNSMGSSGDFKGFEWNSEVILRDFIGLEWEILGDSDGISRDFIG